MRKNSPIDAEWREISYQVFELPNASGTFEARVARIAYIVKNATKQNKAPHLKAVAQFRVKNETELNKKLKQIS